jgi:hypothetical protein
MPAGRKPDVEWRLDENSMFDRMNMAVGTSFSHEAVPKWISEKTYINGNKYSFVDHEYQLKILASKKPEQYTKKCSQLGISELKVRRVLALCYMIPHFSAILTLPTASFASMFAKTRIDPVIRESEPLREAVVGNNDSSELKQIGSSLLYIRGTFTQNAAISVPADMLLHDEVDFSDQDALTSFQSRLTHSKLKWKMKTSTPTVPRYGIDDEFKNSNRWFNFVRCCHCNHQFIPSYKDHVVVPGFTGDIFSLDKSKLPRTRWREAYLACPKCKKRPDLSLDFREWVCENNDEQHNADGTQLSPFDAPGFITVQDLMISRTSYKRLTDFINFGLGQTDEDELSGIQPADLDMMEMVYMPGLVGCVLGIDMGTTCHVSECYIDAGDHLMQRKVHRINYKELDKELDRIVQRCRPIAMVMDSQPYTETVYRLQQKYRNLYASVYVKAKGMRPYRMLDEEEDKVDALFDERQINVNRNIALDFLMEDIRAGIVGNDPMQPKEDREEFRDHMRDMRRVRQMSNLNSPDTEQFAWVKSKIEIDHMHHALLYAWVAAKLRLAARPIIQVSSLQFMSRMKMKTTL